MNLAKAVRDPWVRAQLTLFVVVGALGPLLPRLIRPGALGFALARTDPWPARVFGVVLWVAGAALAVWAGRTMGAALTAEPEPVPDATLVEDGPYRLVRHPIYAGAVLAFIGWTEAWSNWMLALMAGVVLSVFFEAKARVEERWLRARFPAYERYAARVRWRVAWADRRPPRGLP
ncbi:MAG TPA: isoprenylcysteine carboxylmethyltransferase family protein [Gemmatimonadales bacterium]|nr:isoprenylcysteine carboxylmethyltransferase family protein [Gemmatimonadales bacterium]